jgi:DNA-binding XRE family transcriptional regulator
MNIETVHRLLHAAREALDLSQSDVAEVTGVSTRTLHRMENNLGMVGFDILGKLRGYYDGLGVQLVAHADQKRWSLMFSRGFASARAPGWEDSIYDPIPGRVLKAARVMADLTQADLGACARLAHTTVRHLEKGDGKASLENAYRLQMHFEESGMEFSRPDGEFGWMIRFSDLSPLAVTTPSLNDGGVVKEIEADQIFRG